MIPMGFVVASRLFCRAGRLVLLAASLALVCEALTHTPS
jgi:hypothetical protein